MYIIVDDENFITTVGRGGILPDGIEVEDFDFTEDIQAYQYVDDKIVLDKERLQQLQNEQSIRKELQEFQEVLSETDAVALQWWEENELGLEHEMPEQEFQEVMKKRQTARTRIRQLKENEKCY